MKLRLISTQMLLGLGLAVGYTPTTQPFDYFYNKVKSVFRKNPDNLVSQRFKDNQSLTSDQWDDLRSFVNASPRKERLSTAFSKDAWVSVHFADAYQASNETEATFSSLVGDINVPKSLVAIKAENENLDKFKTEESFTDWYQKCTHDPVYKELYKPILNDFKKKNYTFQEKKERIKAWDHEMLCCAQGSLDHEMTHIIKDHTKIKRKINQKIAIGVGLIALPLTLSVLIHNKDKPSPVRNSIAVIAPVSYFSLLTYHLLGQKVSRDKEREADAEVRDNVDILRARANKYARLEQETRPLLRAVDFLFYPLSSHPSDKARKEYYNRRADALEKQQQVTQAKK